MSINSTNPSTLFGGTWEQLQNRFLLGAGTKNAGSTGGEENHTLTISEMPSHTHTQNAHHHSMTGFSSGSGNTGAYMQTSNRSTTSRNTQDTTATNQNTGGSQAHNNMPPYLVVYMWKRIA